MNQLRPWLYIGKYIDTLDQQRLTRYGIRAMLQLADLVEQPEITSLYLPVDDFEPLPFNVLRQGVDFVRDAKQQGHTILVACGAGINRSTTPTTLAITLCVLSGRCTISKDTGTLRTITKPKNWRTMARHTSLSHILLHKNQDIPNA
ncbi:MAG: hypothetical protein GFH27_549293n76 [Chloroflexi bacterium AL-W]|nr:hypothetical protein [Chloroflexi bacterium AL-N1]NOK67809.1 hypothetical protein [Chloroflexi bacterium AL-N10]NOK75421.1 hypothetical protein [Chloroflexi bacterium AL-N5]NOK82209.1 hypothetical protein [Chloroflexi bacterium AL-W]NOK90054.1 hypothetical protein [Chloroflexi bacterium AL-N15]